MGTAITINFLTDISSICAKNKARLPIFHQLYYLAWQLIEFQRETDYRQLKKMFFNHTAILAQEDQLILLTYLLNFAFSKVRENNNSFLQEAYTLYQFGIEKDLLIIDKLFVDDHFINLVSICSALKKFDWIERVLAEKLAPIIKELAPSAYHLAMARLSFAKGDYMPCREYLMGIDHTVYGHSLRARIFQIACAFELKEPSPIIESHCKSYENYLRRHVSIHKQNAQGGLNFISMVRQLIKIQPDKKQLERVLNNYKIIVFQSWLAEKISALK